MPSNQPTIQAIVDEKTKILLDVLAGLSGASTSKFIANVLKEYINQNLTQEEQTAYLKKAQGLSNPKVQSGRRAA